MVTNLDFAPTILDMVGIKSPKEVQGKSFYSNLLGKTAMDWQKSMYYHYYEYPKWHHVQPHYGIRNERYKLIHFYYNVDLWEFYDLKTDPDELKNAINDPSNAAIISQMKIELKELMKKAGNDKSLDDFRKISDVDFGSKHK
jgi:arylsulfatase A-like enzyme